jgi:hypothetical protein
MKKHILTLGIFAVLALSACKVSLAVESHDGGLDGSVLDASQDSSTDSSFGDASLDGGSDQ